MFTYNRESLPLCLASWDIDNIMVDSVTIDLQDSSVCAKIIYARSNHPIDLAVIKTRFLMKDGDFWEVKHCLDSLGDENSMTNDLKFMIKGLMVDTFSPIFDKLLSDRSLRKCLPALYTHSK